MNTKATAPADIKPANASKPATRRAPVRSPQSGKTPAKPARSVATGVAKAASAGPKSKSPETKGRQKLVRDGFTMPAGDFALIARLKQTAVEAKRETKKSELLRAGLHVLASLDAKALVATLNALEPIKVGRPKKGH
jgi:hypothetical protein